MTMKVGHIPDLEYEPWYFEMARRGIETSAMVPSQLAAAVAAGEIDAGPVPLADCFRLEDRIQPVSGFCLACARRAGNLFLYAKRPVEQLKDARIGISDETSTPLRLLQVLLSLKYRVQPEAYVTLQEPYDAFLLAGNRALRQRWGAQGYPYTYDLGEEWYRWTGLPFVAARWVVRQGLPPGDVAVLEDALYVGMEDGMDALYHQSEPRNDLRMRPRDIVEYLDGLRYFIGMSEQKAIDQFRQYLGELGS
jgi:predicted solute-binding protein